MVACRLGVALTITCLLLGCSKESNALKPPASEPAAALAAAAVPAASAAPAAPVTGEPKFSDAAFELSIEAPKAPFKAGQVGALEVVLIAKAPYHVNDKYPIKLKLKETPGVKYDSPVIGKDAVKLEAMKAVMPVSFTPDAAGTRKVAGQFAFSVCTEDKCLMEKRDLALDVAVQ
jgi:hypothetical protein